MVKKYLQVESVNLIVSRLFSCKGIVVADILKADYEFALILVHSRSKVENKLGGSALTRDKQGERLREIIADELESDPDANIIVCGDFNDSPGRDEQEEAIEAKDLVARMTRPIILEDGSQVHHYKAYTDS